MPQVIDVVLNERIIQYGALITQLIHDLYANPVQLRGRDYIVTRLSELWQVKVATGFRVGVVRIAVGQQVGRRHPV